MLQTVVLIDDSPVDRATYQRFLSRDPRQTYQIIEFETGEEAMVWCQTNIADVILLDYQLPEMDGLEFIRELQQQHPDELLPVILLTGLGNTAIAVEALKLGAQDYLDKDQVTQESLPQLVRSVIQQVQLKRQLFQQQTQQQFVAKIALRMRESLDLQRVLDAATEEICQFLQADRVLVYQFDPDWNGLIVSEFVQPGWPIALGQKIQDTCFQSGAAVSYHQGSLWAMADIAHANLTDCHRELLERFAVKANLVVPILQYITIPSDAEPIPSLWGLLIVHHCAAPHEWQGAELSFCSQVAVHLAVSIQQATLYQQAQLELAERKQAELALQESKAKLRLMIKYSPVSLAMFDQEMRYIMASQRWVNDHDRDSRTLEEYLGRSHYELYPEMPERWRQVHQRCLAGAIEKCEEDVFIRANASPQWVRWETRPWYTANGEIGGIVIFSEDITRRKQAECSLADSTARLSLALSASKAGVWDWDLVTNQLIWSPEYYQLYKLDPSIEPNYETWLECIHPSDRDQVNQKVVQALGNSSSEVRIEFRILPLDSMRWFAGIGQIFRNQAGEAIRFIGITLDITQQKQSEFALQKLNAQLQANHQELSQASEAKDAFLQMISHELRTPLNPILGMAEALQEEVFGSLNQRQNQAISMIFQSGQHLLVLINSLLNLVELETRKITLNCSEVPVQSLCTASLAVVTAQAAAKSIQLHTHISPEATLVNVDGEHMQQILTHLLENAIKFTPDGGTVTLGVQVGTMSSPSNPSVAPFMQFSIQDTGIGIAPENLQRLFEVFTQLDDRLSRRYEGIGIGLALVRRLVELHGGNITVESQLGQGSCFTVNIPM